MNPKALSLGELYGEYDLNTNEWTDGVLSSVMRTACAGARVGGGWAVWGWKAHVWEENAWGVLRYEEEEVCAYHPEELSVKGGLGRKF